MTPHSEYGLATLTGMPGTYHAPKNNVTITAEPVIMAAYSPKKNKANFIDEYSVWYPPTSSVSDSGRSNGRRFVSANIETVNTIKEMNSGTHSNTFQMSNDCRIAAGVRPLSQKGEINHPC